MKDVWLTIDMSTEAGENPDLLDPLTGGNNLKAFKLSSFFIQSN